MTEPELDVHLTEEQAVQALRADAYAGLTAEHKWLSPKWLYDAAGSELFERITGLPEYYQTRAEREILRERAVQIAELTESEAVVELGSGSSEKTRILLDGLYKHASLRRFIPLDVSAEALRAACAAIAADYPQLQVRGIVGDFTAGLPRLPDSGQRLVAFLGGTIGNLLPEERAPFLRSVRRALREGEWFLLGADLVKDPERLVRAYDDAAGVTARFNRNVLEVLNRDLGADFDPADFQHWAEWNPQQEWIEISLQAVRAVRVQVPLLGITVDFAAGEKLRTEISAKFRPEGIRDELAAAGFAEHCWWTDAAEDFALVLARAEG